MRQRARNAMVGIAAVVSLTTACTSSGKPTTATTSTRPAHANATPSATTSELPKGVLASIPLTCCGAPDTGAPQWLIGAFGSLWVESHRGNDLFRVDPHSDKVIATIDVHDESCTPPTPTQRYLIINRCNTTSDALIDPRTNQLVGNVPGHANAYAFGSVWGITATFDALERVDLRTNRVTVVRRMNTGPIAFSASEVWVLAVDETGYVDAGIVRIDPKTNRVLGTVHIPDPGYDPYILNAYGSMWIKGQENPVLVRVDIHTLKVTSYPVPGYAPATDVGSNRPAAGAGSIWMRLNTHWVARIDPRSGKIVGRYPSDGQDTGAAVQVGFGSLWITSADGGFLLRDRIDNP